jgi:hypothetical protein
MNGEPRAYVKFTRFVCVSIAADRSIVSTSCIFGSHMATFQSGNPPPYQANSSPRVVYDETHRGKWYMKPSIMSMAHIAHFKAYIEHHSPDTDGTFTFCISNGNGIFVSKVRSSLLASE